MTRIVIAGALGLATAVLGACASEAPAPAAPSATAAAALAVVDPPPLDLPPLPGVVTHDTCGADALASVIGRPRTSIPIPVDLTRRRVVCTTCPTTQDYRPDRLTILYDLQTGTVTGLRCG